jgi:integrase/recombinase XerD
MRFEEFLKEREYLRGVSKKTLIYYRCAFNSWGKHATDGKVFTWIQGMKAAGPSNISINTYICAMRAFFRWAEPERPKIAYLKEERKILATLTVKDIGALLAFNPARVSKTLRRAHLVALTILDTGLRIAEVLSLGKENLDFDNLVIRVIGKGGKHRLVPFSAELRKSLWRYSTGAKAQWFLFATRNNTKLAIRNLGRDLRILGRRWGS